MGYYNRTIEAKEENKKNGYPVLTIPVCKKLGIDVFELDRDDNFSGMIVKDSDGSFSIYVNSNHTPQRKRFTIAHEVGHYALHNEKIGDGLVDDAMYRSGLKNSEEAEANGFAANFLMPLDLLKEAIAEHKTQDAKKLAALFNVSDIAMAIRLGYVT